MTKKISHNKLLLAFAAFALFGAQSTFAMEDNTKEVLIGNVSERSGVLVTAEELGSLIKYYEDETKLKKKSVEALRKNKKALFRIEEKFVEHDKGDKENYPELYRVVQGIRDRLELDKEEGSDSSSSEGESDSDSFKEESDSPKEPAKDSAQQLGGNEIRELCEQTAQLEESVKKLNRSIAKVGKGLDERDQQKSEKVTFDSETEEEKDEKPVPTDSEEDDAAEIKARSQEKQQSEYEYCDHRKRMACGRSVGEKAEDLFADEANKTYYYNTDHFVVNHEDGIVNVEKTLAKVNGRAWYNPMRLLVWTAEKVPFVGRWKRRWEDKALYKLHDCAVSDQVAHSGAVSRGYLNIDKMNIGDKALQQRKELLTQAQVIRTRPIKDGINGLVKGEKRLDRIEAMLFAVLEKQIKADAQVLADVRFVNASKDADQLLKKAADRVADLRLIEKKCVAGIAEVEAALKEKGQQHSVEIIQVLTDNKTALATTQAELQEALADWHALKEKKEQLKSVNLPSAKQQQKHSRLAGIVSARREFESDVASLNTEAKTVYLSQKQYCQNILADSDKRVKAAQEEMEKKLPTVAEKKALLKEKQQEAEKEKKDGVVVV